MLDQLSVQFRSQVRAGWTGLGKITVELGELARATEFDQAQVPGHAIAVAAAALGLHPLLGTTSESDLSTLSQVVAAVPETPAPNRPTMRELLILLGQLAGASPPRPDLVLRFVAAAMRIGQMAQDDLAVLR